jgi:hypothetical protein
MLNEEGLGTYRPIIILLTNDKNNQKRVELCNVKKRWTGKRLFSQMKFGYVQKRFLCAFVRRGGIL